MANRPVRERRQTQPFLYKEEDSSPIIIDTASQSRSAGRLKVIRDINQEIVSNERGQGALRARGRGRGRGRGQRINRAARDDVKASKRARLKHNTAEESDGLPSEPLTDPIDNDAPADRLSDSDFDAGEEESSRASSTWHGTKLLRKSIGNTQVLSLIGNPPTREDLTIEQWYADPYERINPQGPGYGEWRRQNLEKELLQRGFHANRTKYLCAWLMRCNGRFMPLESPKKRGPLKQRHLAITDNDTERAQSADTLDDDHELHETEPTHDQIGLSDIHEQLALGNEIEQGCKQETHSVSPLADCKLGKRRLAQKGPAGNHDQGRANKHLPEPANIEVSKAIESSTPDVSSANMAAEASVHLDEEVDVDKKIALMKRSLNVFNLVYGHEAREPDRTNYNIDYCSRITDLPRSIPRIGLRTQNHTPIRKTVLSKNEPALTNHVIEPEARITRKGQPDQILTFNQTHPHDRKVLTEDSDFGLTLFPPSQTATAEDMEHYYAQFSLAKDFVQHLPGDDSDNSSTNRAAEAEESQEKRGTVQEQLKVKVFPWETEATMHGHAYATDAAGGKYDYHHKFYRTYEDDDKWKRLRDRQRLLTEGGEAAERILAEQAEAAQSEQRRGKRRAETARTRAKRKARAWAIDSDTDDTKKKVKLSGWTPED